MKVAPVAVATAVAVGIALAPGARADNETVSVPKAGPKQVSTTFAGKFPVGTNFTTFITDDGHCKGNVAFNSAHPFKVVVPAGAYNVVKAKMYVTVDSAPVLAGDFMELLDPAGNSEGTDEQKPEMSVEVVNPVPGTWTLLTCQFIPDSAGDHDYKGTITIKTTCKAASPCPTPPKKRR